MKHTQAFVAFLALCVATPVVLVTGDAPAFDGSLVRNRPQKTLRLRGGFDAVRLVSPEQNAAVTPTATKREVDAIDQDLLKGNIARLNHGFQMNTEDFEKFQGKSKEAAYQYHMTQQFLVLQNERIESQMPGGHNCSYAESWFTGDLWDRVDDEMKWSRSAWLQCERATCWEEMPAVWKRIMRESWEELQEFLAIVALPDGGVSTKKFQAHMEAWRVMQAAYMSNVNQVADSMQQGPLREQVESKAKAAKAVLDARNAEQRTMPLWDWLYYKAGHIARKVSKTETPEDKLEQHRPTEVQLFGVPVFNTKDSVSDRIWNIAASQGDTMFVYPIKALAWVIKKLERDGIIPYPEPVPTTSSMHVLLNNTNTQTKAKPDLRRNNALEYLKNYISNKINVKYNRTMLDTILDDHDAPPADGEPSADGQAAAAGDEEFRLMEIRDLPTAFETIEKRVRESVIAEVPADSDKPAPAVDLEAELVSKVAALKISSPRQDIAKLLEMGGGGELRLVARALNITLPTARVWMDDPTADEGIMKLLIAHPRIQKLLTQPEEMEAPVIYEEDV